MEVFLCYNLSYHNTSACYLTIPACVYTWRVQVNMDMSSSIVHIIHYFEKGASLNLELAISVALASQELPTKAMGTRIWAQVHCTKPLVLSQLFIYSLSSFPKPQYLQILHLCKFLTVNINLDFTDSVETIHHHIHDVIPTFTSTSTLIVYRLTNACVVNTKQGLWHPGQQWHKQSCGVQGTSLSICWYCTFFL